MPIGPQLSVLSQGYITKSHDHSPLDFTPLSYLLLLKCFASSFVLSNVAMGKEVMGP